MSVLEDRNVFALIDKSGLSNLEYEIKVHKTIARFKSFNRG
jgi:hypothetical protein